MTAEQRVARARKASRAAAKARQAKAKKKTKGFAERRCRLDAELSDGYGGVSQERTPRLQRFFVQNFQRAFHSFFALDITSVVSATAWAGRHSS